MNILDQILEDKKKEVALKKSIIPIDALEKFILFESPTISLTARILESKTGIIAEHKRRSPSKPIINNNHTVEDVVMGYEKANVSGLSILTDGKYFGGSLDDLILAKAATKLPILRKDFIIDAYQIIEAKAYGADVILLIAAVLSPAEIKELSELAQSLELEVLLEVHNAEELHQSIMPSLNLIGVNNRNLKTFETTIKNSIDLVDLIPDAFVKISESGISEEASVRKLQEIGYNGFLMGEHFMKTNNPGKEAQIFIENLLK